MDFQEIFGLKKGTVLSIVGGGGKTTSLHSMATELKNKGMTVLITTTTAIINPEIEGRIIDKLFIGQIDQLLSVRPQSGTITAAAWKRIDNAGKLKGFGEDMISEIKKASHYDVILVEADGSAGRPIKAPAIHEPPIPSCSDVICGIIGLDCLHKTLDEKTVHRPACFASVTGISERGIITEKGIARLCTAKSGLFKNAPENAKRIVLLNKADTPKLEEKAEKIAEEIVQTKNPVVAIDSILVCTMKWNNIKTVYPCKEIQSNH